MGNQPNFPSFLPAISPPPVLFPHLFGNHYHGKSDFAHKKTGVYFVMKNCKRTAGRLLAILGGYLTLKEYSLQMRKIDYFFPFLTILSYSLRFFHSA